MGIVSTIAKVVGMCSTSMFGPVYNPDCRVTGAQSNYPRHQQKAIKARRKKNKNKKTHRKNK